MQVLVSKWGNSLGLRLPRALTSEIGVSEGQKVEIRAEGGKLVIEPVRSRYTWEQLLANTTPKALREAWDWGEDIGREIVEE